MYIIDDNYPTEVLVVLYLMLSVCMHKTRHGYLSSTLLAGRAACSKDVFYLY